MTKNEFITRFIADGKGDLTAAAKAWEASPDKKARGKAGSPRAYLDFLVEAPRTKEDAEGWLKEEGSENMQRASSHYLAIAEAIEKVREAAKPATKKAA